MKNKKILISALALIFMVGYAFVVYNVMFAPAKMFNKALDKVVKKIDENALNLDFDKSITDINVKFNTSANDLKSFENYTYGVKFGVDSESKSSETKLYMIDKNNTEYSYTGYIKNSNLYHKLSSFDKLILYNLENQDLISFFENADSINTDDIKYLINTISKSVKKNLNKKNFSKSKDTLTISGKDIKVTKNTYTASNDDFKRLYKSVYDDLFNDSKASKILTSLTGFSKEEIDKNLEYINKYTDNMEFVCNVYSRFNKILGFDIYENNEKAMSYYYNDDDFVIKNDVYDITGVKKGSNLNVSVKSNNYEVATLVFSKWKQDDFSCDFMSSIYAGKVSYKREKGKDYQAKLNVSLNDGQNNYSFEVNAKQSKSKIADIDINKAQKLTEEEFEEVLIDFVTSLEDTPLSYLSDLFMYDYSDVDYSYEF